MDSQREGNSCQQCGVTSSAARNQGLQSKSGEFSNSNVQQNRMLARERLPSARPWHIHICPTTGGDIELTIPMSTTVEGLKNVIARKLKLPMDKINLLYKERILRSGGLLQHGVVDGCKFTLLPNVETGLSTPKADHHSIMQVLENLSDRQVNEFLAGKAPLTLAMRLGEHMMFVQLQLSSSPFAANKQNNNSHGYHQNSSHFPSSVHRHTASSSSTSRRQQHHLHRHVNPIQQPVHQLRNHHYHPYQHSPQSTILPPHHQHYSQQPSTKPRDEPISAASSEKNPVHLIDMLKNEETNTSKSSSCSSTTSATSTAAASMPNPPHDHLKDIFKNKTQPVEQGQPETPKGFRSPPMPTRILTPPIDSPVSLSSGYTSSSPMSDCSVPSSPEAITPDASFSASASRLDYEQHLCSTRQQYKVKPVRLFPQPEMEDGQRVEEKLQEFRKVSSSNNCNSDAHTACPEVKAQREAKAEPSQNGHRGAVIDSMYHMGRGVYSGTFSGTLNPTLQDGNGRPKRSLGTIVHILNDLLGAAPKGKLQVDSLSGGVTPSQHVWSQGKASNKGSSPRVHRHSGIRPLCGHLECPSREHPVKRQPQSQDDLKKLDKENQVMKDKVEQVQMMLQQRRQRRKARREARASPYTWQTDADDMATGSRTNVSENKNSLEDVKVDSTHENPEEDMREEATEHDGTFTSELKPEAVLV